VTASFKQRALRWTLERVSKLLPVRTIRGENGSPYLSKYLLLGQDGEFAPGCRLYLHRFHRGDLDHDLHNHPWEWAISLILVGGYQEQLHALKKSKFQDGLFTLRWEIGERDMLPGMVNVLLADTFHRVDLLDGECWTLFLTGPKTQSWGFLNDSGIFTPWREQLKKHGIEVREPWKTERRWA